MHLEDSIEIKILVQFIMCFEDYLTTRLTLNLSPGNRDLDKHLNHIFSFQGCLKAHEQARRVHI